MVRGPGLLGAKPTHQPLAHLPLAGPVAGRYVVGQLHSGAGLLRSRRGKLGGWLYGGTPAEEGDGAEFGFSSASPLNQSSGGAAAWVLVVSGGWRGCCRWRGLGHSFVRLQHVRGRG